jgi:hypothetical protein
VVGLSDGMTVGVMVGNSVGEAVGIEVSRCVGDGVGVLVGEVGCRVGTRIELGRVHEATLGTRKTCMVVGSGTRHGAS